MAFSFSGMNLWAVIVSAIATFIIGGVWYGALFPKTWVALHGFSEQELQSMQNNQLRNLAVFFATDFVTALFVSVLVINLGIVSLARGAMLGFILWLGMRVTIGAQRHAAYDKPLGAFFIDLSHELVCLIVMGAIIGAWR